MAQDHFAEVYLRPHIVRFLFVKLNEDRRRHTPNGDTIWREIFRELSPAARLVEVQPADRHPKPIGRLRMALRISEHGELTASTNSKVANYAEAEYKREFTSFVDEHFYSGIIGTKELAILAFRTLYNITEEDLPLRSSVSSYHHYEKSLKRPMKRGGARPKSGPAKCPRPELQKRRGQ